MSEVFKLSSRHYSLTRFLIQICIFYVILLGPNKIYQFIQITTIFKLLANIIDWMCSIVKMIENKKIHCVMPEMVLIA